MDYPCDKFGDCSFSRFGFIVRTDRQTESHTHTQTDATERLIPATVVRVNLRSQSHVKCHCKVTRYVSVSRLQNSFIYLIDSIDAAQNTFHRAIKWHHEVDFLR